MTISGRLIKPAQGRPTVAIIGPLTSFDSIAICLWLCGLARLGFGESSVSFQRIELGRIGKSTARCDKKPLVLRWLFRVERNL